MAVLNKDEFLKAINERVGNDTSDDALAFIENMTDTYSHLEEAGQDDKETVEYWKQEAQRIDDSWRVKYQSRFFSGGKVNAFDSDDGEEDDEPQVNEDIHIKDLFE